MTFKIALQWRHNERHSISNHRRLDWLLNRLFRRRSKKTSKLSSASLAFVRGIHRWRLASPHRRPVTRKMFAFDDVIMAWRDNILVCILRNFDLAHPKSERRLARWTSHGCDYALSKISVILHMAFWIVFYDIKKCLPWWNGKDVCLEGSFDNEPAWIHAMTWPSRFKPLMSEFTDAYIPVSHISGR